MKGTVFFPFQTQVQESIVLVSPHCTSNSALRRLPLFKSESYSLFGTCFETPSPFIPYYVPEIEVTICWTNSQPLHFRVKSQHIQSFHFLSYQLKFCPFRVIIQNYKKGILIMPVVAFKVITNASKCVKK